MGLSFLQQLLMVAGLAFASGLLAGLAVLRGEIGELRTGSVSGSPVRNTPTTARRPGATRRKQADMTWDKLVKVTATWLGELDPALKWVLISLILMLGASAGITRLLD